jgi:hypothetical protein
MRQRKNLPAGLFFARKQPSKDIVGERIGELTVIPSAGSDYSKVRCDVGHETLKTRSYLLRALRSKENVCCSECRRLEAERKQSERMGWPREPEAAE